jgi:hypothetical protein
MKDMKENKTPKNISITDFLQNPLWTWEEDDGDTLIPIKYIEHLPDDHNAIFIKCDFKLRDNTMLIGVISIRMSDHKVYLIKFSDDNGRLIQLPLQPELVSELQKQIIKIYQLLGKPHKDIFPLTFTTPYIFSDGSPLKGEINI